VILELHLIFLLTPTPIKLKKQNSLPTILPDFCISMALRFIECSLVLEIYLQIAIEK
jgi:hypothetical protein